MTTVGVLALQGDVREHVAVLDSLNVATTRVRRPEDLHSIDALVLPGGESTTIDKLLRAFDLFDPVKQGIANGLPTLGSCAGMILMARTILDGTTDQQTLDAIPMTVRRNAFGRQVDSSEVELTWVPDGSTMHATFIRAPWVEEYDADVQVLATADAHGGKVVAVQYKNCIATAFHPEISGDSRVHQALIDLIA